MSDGRRQNLALSLCGSSITILDSSDRLTMTTKGLATACWTLMSSSGRAQLNCLAISRSERSDSLVCSIHIAGEFWQRGQKKTGTNTVSDFDVVLPQVLLNPAALTALRERLVEWHVNPSSFSIEVGVKEEGDQQFTFAIGRDPGLIYSVEKPACMLSYVCGAAMEGRWSFVIDQSCIHLCAESLTGFIRAAT